MKRIYFAIILASLCLAAGLAKAQAGQERLFLDLQYNMALPLGSFKNELISKPSLLGGSAAIQYQFNPQWRAGLQLGYQRFLEKFDRQVYEVANNERISAVRQKQLQSTPIMAIATWLPNADNPKAVIQPFLRAGAGLAIHSYQDFLGEYSIADESKTGFAAQLGGGIKLPFGFRRNASFNLGANYVVMPLNAFGASNANQLQAIVGLSFPLQ